MKSSAYWQRRFEELEAALLEKGERYNAEGEEQICEYLDYWNLDTGYMLSFNFNKNKTPGVQELHFKEYTIVEAVV